MSRRIRPATLARDASGTPFSAEYGDVYHSRAGAFAQARHVFLGGNALPERWASKRSFTILETGFGLGTNFLATWRAWRDDPHRCERLHFVSIEKHPLSADALRHTDPDLADLADELAARWPPPLPGMHRLCFEGGAVTLTLVLADVADVLPRLRFGVDAFYFDGFAPAKNPEMWTPAVLKAAARLARTDATCATYSAASAVAAGLAAGGFEMTRRTGFGGKREMLAGRFAPRFRVRRHEPPVAPSYDERRAIVIGGGLAGANVAASLGARGWSVSLLDRGPALASATSANPAGALHPMLARDDNIAARLTRAGFLLARSRLDSLASVGAIESRCGFLECAPSAPDEARMRETIDALGLPSGFASFVDASEGSALAGQTVRHGGFWFPAGGWVRPRALCAALVAAGGAIDARFGCAVAGVARRDDRWSVLDAQGREMASAAVVVIAAGEGMGHLAQPALLRLRSVRGQLTLVPEARFRAPHVVVGGDGYCLPAIDGRVVVGATYDFDDTDPHPRPALDGDNLARVARLLPDALPSLDVAAVEGRVGFRTVAVDRLPVIGCAVDEALARADVAMLRGAHPADLPRRAGLYFAGALASRGLTGGALAGELVASLCEGEPPPIEADLVDAVDPGRFLLRSRRLASSG